MEYNCKNNVKKIIEKNQCFKCGMCETQCSRGAIKSLWDNKKGFYMQQLDDEKCIQCGNCLKYCPVMINHSSLDFVGPYKSVSLYYSKDQSIRNSATSGGAINRIIYNSIESGFVGDAYMVGYDNKSPNWTTLTKINTININELTMRPREYSSRYTSVPICSCLNDLDKNVNSLIVGLPCQISALREYVTREKITNIFLIGMCCSGAISFNATRFYLKKLKINFDEVTEYYYRGNGWPGKHYIQLKNSCYSQDKENIFSHLFISQYFKNTACRNCIDHYSYGSDITCFDPWNQGSMKNDAIGKTAVIARTQNGEKLLNNAISNNYLTRTNDSLNKHDVLESQKWVVALKNKLRPLPLSLKLYYLLVDIVDFLNIKMILTIKYYELMSKLFIHIVMSEDKKKGK